MIPIDTDSEEDPSISLGTRSNESILFPWYGIGADIDLAMVADNVHQADVLNKSTLLPDDISEKDIIDKLFGKRKS